MDETHICTIRYKFPVGELELGSIGDRLCLSLWPCSTHYEAIRRRLSNGFGATIVDGQWTDVLRQAVEELRFNYFRAYDMNPLPLRTFGTGLQQEVWRQLTRIPSGCTVSYSELAALAGNPLGVRPVAHAVAINPVAWVIPCHLIVPKETLDKAHEIRKTAEKTLFKGQDLYLLDSIDVGEFAYGSDIKRELIKLQLA